MRVGGYINPPVIPGTYVYQENKANDYRIDRIRQKHFNFSGLSQTAIQDTAMQEKPTRPDNGPLARDAGERRQIHNPRPPAPPDSRPRPPERHRAARTWRPDGYKVRSGVPARPEAAPIAPRQSSS